jgi:hypothetical protein
MLRRQARLKLAEMVLNQSKDILERRMDEFEVFTIRIAMNQDWQVF